MFMISAENQTKRNGDGGEGCSMSFVLPSMSPKKLNAYTHTQSTSHKIYYSQAEILSSQGAIHQPHFESHWIIWWNYADQGCL